jgi:hypothetical protein
MWACSTNGKDGNAYETSVGEPDGKTLFGRPRHRWEANIRMDLKINRVRNCVLDSSGLVRGPVTSCCGHSNDRGKGKNLKLCCAFFLN